jgi:hypothetical protein
MSDSSRQGVRHLVLARGEDHMGILIGRRVEIRRRFGFHILGEEE